MHVIATSECTSLNCPVNANKTCKPQPRDKDVTKAKNQDESWLVLITDIGRVSGIRTRDLQALRPVVR